jgi:uncharacterized protein HemX
VSKAMWVGLGLVAILVVVALVGFWLGQNEMATGALFGASSAAGLVGAYEARKKVAEAEEKRKQAEEEAKRAREKAQAALQETKRLSQDVNNSFDEITEEVIHMSDENKTSEGERLFGGGK